MSFKKWHKSFDRLRWRKTWIDWRCWPIPQTIEHATDHLKPTNYTSCCPSKNHEPWLFVDLHQTSSWKGGAVEEKTFGLVLREQCKKKITEKQHGFWCFLWTVPFILWEMSVYIYKYIYVCFCSSNSKVVIVKYGVLDVIQFWEMSKISWIVDN